VELVIIDGLPIALAAETPVGDTVTAENTETDPIALAAETPVTLILTGRLIVTDPVALAAETPVTSTGTGLFQVPEFQVLRSQPVIKAIYEILIIALFASLAGNWIVKSPALEDLSPPKLMTATAGSAAWLVVEPVPAVLRVLL
tara:strand:+ start:138 stop:569 length:432 start_codon:yes stop_codon:yes gene_type:complete